MYYLITIHYPWSITFILTWMGTSSELLCVLISYLELFQVPNHFKLGLCFCYRVVVARLLLVAQALGVSQHQVKTLAALAAQNLLSQAGIIVTRPSI